MTVANGDEGLPGLSITDDKFSLTLGDWEHHIHYSDTGGNGDKATRSTLNWRSITVNKDKADWNDQKRISQSTK